MKLKSTGTLTNEKPGDSEHYYDSFSTSFDELTSKSDLVIAVVNGEEHVMAGENFRGGCCECCSSISVRDIEKVEGFKIVKEEV